MVYKNSFKTTLTYGAGELWKIQMLAFYYSFDRGNIGSDFFFFFLSLLFKECFLQDATIN